MALPRTTHPHTHTRIQQQLDPKVQSSAVANMNKHWD